MPRSMLLCLLCPPLACTEAEKARRYGPIDTSEPDPEAQVFVLAASPSVLALPFATAGEAVDGLTLTVSNDGGLGSVSALDWTVTGEFTVSGSADRLGPGEARALRVAYTGPTDEPRIATGTLALSADGQQLSLPLAAVLGDPALPAVTWSEDGYGERTIAALPSAPFPDGSASWDDPSVLIFLPKNFTDQGDIGVVTHLHGHNATLREVVAAQYLVEQHALSGRDAILVVPQGPEEAASGNFGKLMDEGGHARLIRDVVSLLYREGRIAQPVLGQQVLSSHSGGYLATAAILRQGGLPIDGVHLFDSLYAEADTFEDFVLEGGLFRSVYTASGGTVEDNQALAAALRAEGVDVGDSFDDPALDRDEVSVGYSPFSHSGCTFAGRAYGRWLAASGLRPSPLAPLELRAVLASGDQAQVSWREDRGAPGEDVEVWGSEDGETWSLLASATASPVEVPLRPFVTARRGSEAWGSGDASDVYGATGGDWLVVDGFDRVLGGSWTAPTHDFAARVGAAIGAGFSAASDEAVAQGAVRLEDYPAVIWLLGDESTLDETFSEEAAAAIAAYLDAGGRLIVSGAELGYATETDWLEAVLGVSYVSDDADTDQAGGYTFGVVYDEDYPDVLSGDETLWRYATGGGAAVTGRGGAVIAVGFPLETMSDATLAEALPALAAALAP